MSGHSKWAKVKHKKAGTDAKRGALFSKFARMITVAAKEGSPDPETNFKLRQAMERARSAGMPKDNIARAIERSRGGSDAADILEVEYEAYGPGGSAFLIRGLTDNPNRTTSEIKHILDERGGRLAAGGSVAWLFSNRVILEFDLAGRKAEEVELDLIDAGAEDTLKRGNRLQAAVPPERAEGFTLALETKGLRSSASTFTAVAKNPLAVSDEDRVKVETLTNALEDHPEINDVWTNIEIAEP